MAIRSSEDGQALVIVLLIVSVVVTIALSVASRSITDISISQKEEDALRAIGAAEAGIERALISGTGGAITGSLGPAGTVATYQASPTNLGEGTANFVSPLSLKSGESTTVWFVSHDADGKLVCDSGRSLPCFTGSKIGVCWGNSGTGSSTPATPALELSVFYKNTPSQNDYSSVRVARAVYDPDSSRRSSNQFSLASGTCNIEGKTFPFSTGEIDLATLGIPGGVTGTAGGLQFARIRLLYNTDSAHQAGVFVVGGLLPKQGTKIESTGFAGQAQRKVIVNRLYADLPPIFDFAAFSSSGNLSK